MFPKLSGICQTKVVANLSKDIFANPINDALEYIRRELRDHLGVMDSEVTIESARVISENDLAADRWNDRRSGGTE